MNKGEPLTGYSRHVIQLFDVDPLGIVWHGNYFRFFETARFDLLQEMGFDFTQMEASGCRWPIVDFRVKYLSPVTLHQSIVVKAVLAEYENRLKIAYEIRSDTNPTVLYTKGTSCQMAVPIGKNEALLVTPRCLVDRVEQLLGKRGNTYQVGDS